MFRLCVVLNQITDGSVLQSSLMAASIYQDRLEKLANGYDENKTMPNAISNFIISLMQMDQTILVNRVFFGFIVDDKMINRLELHMDGFVSRVIGTNMVSQYEILYIKNIIDKQENVNDFILKNKHNITKKYVEKIHYDANNLSFVHIRQDEVIASYFSDYYYMFKINALDSSGSIMCSSSWQSIGLVWFFSHKMGVLTQRQFEEFFANNIDKNNHENIGLQEWILIISQMSKIELTEFELTRIFYHIIHHTQSTANLVDKYQFGTFMSIHGMGGCNNSYWDNLCHGSFEKYIDKIMKNIGYKWERLY
eukprot:240143_1